MKGREPCSLREGANARAEGERGDQDPKLLKGSEIPECFCAVLGKEDEVGQLLLAQVTLSAFGASSPRASVFSQMGSATSPGAPCLSFCSQRASRPG